ncbi:MAG: S9 family peptidase [Muribaculaceae bacterium]|nr:S9 family peptidase [Muribaculaceae bacterium]
MNKIFNRLFLACIIAASVAVTATAQKQFTLEDLNFGGTNYRNMTPKNRNIVWQGDKPLHVTGDSCWAIDTKNGREKLLFTRSQLSQWAGVDKVYNLTWLNFPYEDKPWALAMTDSARILVDIKAHKPVWKQSVDGEDGDKQWNKTSRAVAYVHDHNLWVKDAQGNTRQVTTDGSDKIVYAQSVHRNEFGIDGGIFWNNAGTKVAFYRMDQSMVTDYPLIDVPEPTDTTRYIATPAPETYPMAGQTSHKVTVGVYDLASGNTTYLNTGDPTDRYYSNISWSPEDDQIYIFELNREQNDCQLFSYNPVSGNRNAELYRETHPKYVEPQSPITFLPWDSQQFIMQSEKDGFNHLYLHDRNGKQLRQLTQGNWVVMSVLGFDASTQSVIYTSNEINPLQQNIFAVSTVTGERHRVDEGGKGWHGASLSPSGKWLIDYYQEPDVPRNIAIVNTATGQSVRYYTAPDPWQGYTVPTYETGTIKAADGTTDLYYRVVKPADFDPTKKYPTVVYVYGGPHAHNVDARWHCASRSWETYMAQKGYVLFILDNRGSANRGRDFENATWHKLGQVEMADQMKGVDFLKTQAYVDTTRLGVHGWSYGGFMTISLMTNYPDVFKVGVAGGPVIDWKWYEVMYGERYMGTPQSNPEGYALTSLIPKAKDLKGRLQIIIGLNDPTVLPQHAYSFLKACIAAGTQPDFFVYPGQGHNMSGHQSVHLHERITRYFDDYLK